MSAKIVGALKSDPVSPLYKTIQFNDTNSEVVLT